MSSCHDMKTYLKLGTGGSAKKSLSGKENANTHFSKFLASKNNVDTIDTNWLE
jgi:hypothetical protein